jgi:high-affinity iron transporter
VFLLAAAQTSHGSRWWAVLGGVTGIAVAIALGIGLYFGGVKFDLGRFFRVTGVFLVLIAAGLVLSALRTAHEAGWVTIGQQQVFDLSSWIPGRSVRGALVTGLFGIPTDPRLIEVLGWLLYAVPVLVVFLWPARLAAAPAARRRLLAATAALLLLGAALLAISVPAGESTPVPQARTVADGQGHTATVSLTTTSSTASLSITPDDGSTRTIALTGAGDDSVDGVPVRVWQATSPASSPSSQDGAPTVTLTELAGLTGGRLPVGISAARTPGPFVAQWAVTTVYTVRAEGNCVVKAQASSNRTAVLSGGGLAAPKTVSLGALPTDWSTVGADDQSVASQLTLGAQQRAERQLWRVWLPLILGVFALACALVVLRGIRAMGRPQPAPEGRSVANAEVRQPVA